MATAKRSRGGALTLWPATWQSIVCKARSANWLLLMAIVGMTWTAICLGLVGWLVTHATAPARCPASLPYPAFCKAEAADELMAGLRHLAGAYAGGLGLVGAVAAVVALRSPASAIGWLKHDGRERGQSMVEFALVLPIFMFMLIGVFEYGLMAYGIGASRFGSSEGARVASQVGRGANTPVTADTAGTYLSGWPRTGALVDDCNADCEALVAIHKSPLGGTNLVKINEIDIWQLYQDPSTGQFFGGATSTKNAVQPAWTPTNPGLNPQFPSTRQINRYTWDGTKFTVAGDTPYPTAGGTVGCPPAQGRNDCYGSSDFMALTIQYQYDWKSGLFARLGSPKFYTTYYLRIEPQRFS